MEVNISNTMEINYGWIGKDHVDANAWRAVSVCCVTPPMR
jgi:hypothetical protein